MDTTAMFGITRLEFQSLEWYGQDSNIWQEKANIVMFARITSKFPCLEE